MKMLFALLNGIPEERFLSSFSAYSTFTWFWCGFEEKWQLYPGQFDDFYVDVLLLNNSE